MHRMDIKIKKEQLETEQEYTHSKQLRMLD